ncbi:MAG: LamG-like jellyroll fold domain-containing protein, partial [Planctomycetota bacterium]
ADLDGDGDLDAVIGLLFETASEPVDLVYLENPDDPTGEWPLHVIADDIWGAFAVSVNDMDNDGDPDVILGEHVGSTRLMIFENNGDGTQWTRHVIDNGGVGIDHHDGALSYDFDGDGDFDIVSVGWHNQKVWYYENLAATPPVDDLPPGAPTGVTAEALASFRVELNWRRPVDNVGATDYEVYRDGVLLAAVPFRLTYTDDTAIPSTTHSYSIVAFDAAGNQSPPSAPVDVTTLSPEFEPPTAPGNLLVDPISTSRIDVSWDPSTDNRAVAGYVVYLDGAEVESVDADTLIYTFSTLLPGTEYTVSVSAIDAEGNASDPALASQTFTTPLPVTGLWGAWGFEGTGPEATDTSGNLNHGFLQNGAQRRTAGYFGSGLELFGTAGNVDLGGLDVFSAGMTIMMWIRPDTFGVKDARLISKSTSSDANDHLWMLSTIAGPSLRFRLQTDDGLDTATLIGSGGTLSTEVWIHVAATYDGSTMRLFQDGVEVGSLPKSGAIARDPAVSAWIGGNPGETGQVFDGHLDEVKIFGRALTPTEIQTEMGQPSPTAFDDEDPTSPLNLHGLATSSSSLSLSWNAATDNAVVAGYRVFQDGTEIVTTTGLNLDLTGLSAATLYRFSVIAFDAAGNESPVAGPIDVTTHALDVLPPTVPGSFLALPASAARVELEWTSSTDNVGVVGYRLLRNGVEIDLLPETQAVYSDQGLTPDTTYTYEVFAFDAEGNTSAGATDVATTLATVPELWAAWGFEENEGTTALDGAGNGNDGELENGAVRNVAGYVGSALETNGVSGNVNLGDLDIPSSELTIMCWIRADDFEVRDARILSKSTGSSANDHLWMLSTISGPSLRFRLQTDDGSDTATVVGSGGTLTAATWTHAAATYDGTTIRLYQDGLEVGSTAKTGIVLRDPLVSAWIGGNPGQPNQVFDGRVDDLKIFTRALSVAEIHSEMDQPVPPPFDDEPPTAPQNLAGLATSTSTVDLSWNAATDNFFVLGYRIFQNSVEIGTTTELNYGVSGLSAGTSYNFSVVAFDASGNDSSEAGPVLVLTQLPDVQPPSAPGSFTATAISIVRIDLDWTPSTDNVAVVGYRLLRDETEIAVLPAAQTRFVDAGLSPAT